MSNCRPVSKKTDGPPITSPLNAGSSNRVPEIVLPSTAIWPSASPESSTATPAPALSVRVLPSPVFSPPTWAWRLPPSTSSTMPASRSENGNGWTNRSSSIPSNGSLSGVASTSETTVRSCGSRPVMTLLWMRTATSLSPRPNSAMPSPPAVDRSIVLSVTVTPRVLSFMATPRIWAPRSGSPPWAGSRLSASGIVTTSPGENAMLTVSPLLGGRPLLLMSLSEIVASSVESSVESSDTPVFRPMLSVIVFPFTVAFRLDPSPLTSFRPVSLSVRVLSSTAVSTAAPFRAATRTPMPSSMIPSPRPSLLVSNPPKSSPKSGQSSWSASSPMKFVTVLLETSRLSSPPNTLTSSPLPDPKPGPVRSLPVSRPTPDPWWRMSTPSRTLRNVLRVTAKLVIRP